MPDPVTDVLDTPMETSTPTTGSPTPPVEGVPKPSDALESPFETVDGLEPFDIGLDEEIEEAMAADEGEGEPDESGDDGDALDETGGPPATDTKTPAAETPAAKLETLRDLMASMRGKVDENTLSALGRQLDLIERGAMTLNLMMRDPRAQAVFQEMTGAGAATRPTNAPETTRPAETPLPELDVSGIDKALADGEPVGPVIQKALGDYLKQALGSGIKTTIEPMLQSLGQQVRQMIEPIAQTAHTEKATTLWKSFCDAHPGLEGDTEMRQAIAGHLRANPDLANDLGRALAYAEIDVKRKIGTPEAAGGNGDGKRGDRGGETPVNALVLNQISQRGSASRPTAPKRVRTIAEAAALADQQLAGK